MTYDFYDLLGVPDDAARNEIKDAFRDKVQEVHPDLNDDPRAPAQFTALKKGYDTLRDPVERKAYDRLGHEDYVAKRLEGLPSADQWKPADSEGSASGGLGASSSGSTGTTAGASTGATAGASSSATSGGASSRTTSTTGATGGSGATGTATGGAGSTAGGSTASASTGSATGAGSASTATGTSTRTGGTNASSTRTGATSAAGTGTGSASDAAAGSSATGDADTSRTADGPGLVERLRSINYGWPLVFLTTLVYAVGGGMYARENRDALRELVAQVRASGTDVAALREALLAADYGLSTVFEFVRSTALVGSTPGPGVLIVVGAVLMPAVFFVVVRTTRQAFAWQPTYLYVAAVLAPLAGLGANAGGVDRPVLTVVAFGLLPLGAVVALLFNAFVTPRLKRLF